jgi:hypothetical protein
MVDVRKHLKGPVFGHVLLAICLCVAGSAAQAQSRSGADDYPFSIMKPEAGERRARPRVKQVTPPAEAEPQSQPVQEARKRPRRVRGSSTFSTIPTYRSPLTPLGTAPTIGTAPTQAYPASRAAPVPGVRGRGGMIAIAPGRPAGQTFQDRVTSCVHAAGAAGVRPGQLGTFTRTCANR